MDNWEIVASDLSSRALERAGLRLGRRTHGIARLRHEALGLRVDGALLSRHLLHLLDHLLEAGRALRRVHALAIAHDHAAKTEDVAEQVTPAEIGGFVIHLGDVFNKYYQGRSFRTMGMLIESGVPLSEVDRAGERERPSPVGYVRLGRSF